MSEENLSQKELDEFNVETLQQAVKFAKKHYRNAELVSVLGALGFAGNMAIAFLGSTLWLQIICGLAGLFLLTRLPSVVRQQELWAEVLKIAKQDLKTKVEGFQAK